MLFDCEIGVVEATRLEACYVEIAPAWVSSPLPEAQAQAQKGP